MKKQEREVIKSLYFDQDEILKSIIELYVPNGFEVDASYGNGVFYKNIEAPKYKFDIDPRQPDVINASSVDLPLDENSVSSLVFDPPFLTYIYNGRDHKDGSSIMASRFSGYEKYEDLEAHYVDSLKEFRRVLSHKGILVFKCQDIIHNHKMHCTHNNVINWANELGFRLKDLFILGAKTRLPSPQAGKQRHARIFHCYFLVLENWKK